MPARASAARLGVVFVGGVPGIGRPATQEHLRKLQAGVRGNVGRHVGGQDDQSVGAETRGGAISHGAALREADEDEGAVHAVLASHNLEDAVST